ncbi:hypothetical protein Hanom_Chr04g00310401 [Helianthus anomalus]
MFCCMCHIQSECLAFGNTLAHTFIRARSLSVTITLGSITPSSKSFNLCSSHMKFPSFSLGMNACTTQNDKYVDVTPII